MIIREATTDDSPAICKICREALGYDCTQELIKERLAALDKKRGAVFVSEIDKTVTGFIHIELFNTLYYESMGNIMGLAVSDGYRRLGCGKALLEAAENWAKTHGISKIRLNSGGARTEAHKFYRSRGYTDEKQQLRFMKKL